MKKYVIYTRVSTRDQGDSGLGLDGQKRTCSEFIKSQNGEIVHEYSDISSGKSRTRAGLLSAIDKCLDTEATLVIAKLDRLARDVEFTFKVVNTGIDIHFCDMPQVNTMILGVFASVAQYERELISSRTKAALDQIVKGVDENGYHTSKAGNAITKLGAPKGVNMDVARAASAEAKAAIIAADSDRKQTWEIIKDLRSRKGENGQSVTIREIAETLNNIGKKTPSGKSWTVGQVSRALSNWGKYFD